MGDAKYIVPWPGYTGPKTPGPLHLVEWPDSHPDTHCEYHTFTPEEDTPGMCKCGWTEKNTTAGKQLEPLRLITEKVLLLRLVELSPYRPEEVLYAGCLEYCARFGYKMEGPLDLKVVVEWIRKELLPVQMRMLLKKYSRELKEVDLTTPAFLEAMMEQTLDLAKSVIHAMSVEQLERSLKNPIFPHHQKIEKELRQRLEELKNEQVTQEPPV